MEVYSKFTQYNLDEKFVRSIGTIACNFKPAIRDKYISCNIKSEVRRIGVQTVKNNKVVSCQTTFGSLHGKSSTAVQTGCDDEIGHLYSVLYILYNDCSFINLKYEVCNIFKFFIFYSL